MAAWGESELFCQGINFKASSEEVRELFARHGTVKEVVFVGKRDGKSSQVALIRMASRSDAETARKAIHHADLKQRSLTVRWSNTSRALWIGHLHESVTNEMLNAAFAQFGTIERAVVACDMQSNKSRSYGFVVYENKRDAAKAFARTRESPFTIAQTVKPVKVEWAKAEDTDQGYGEELRSGNRRALPSDYDVDVVCRFLEPGTQECFKANRLAELELEYLHLKKVLKLRKADAEKQVVETGACPSIATLANADPAFASAPRLLQPLPPTQQHQQQQHHHILGSPYSSAPHPTPHATPPIQSPAPPNMPPASYPRPPPPGSLGGPPLAAPPPGVAAAAPPPSYSYAAPALQHLTGAPVPYYPPPGFRGVPPPGATLPAKRAEAGEAFHHVPPPKKQALLRGPGSERFMPPPSHAPHPPQSLLAPQPAVPGPRPPHTLPPVHTPQPPPTHLAPTSLNFVRSGSLHTIVSQPDEMRGGNAGVPPPQATQAVPGHPETAAQSLAAYAAVQGPTPPMGRPILPLAAPPDGQERRLFSKGKSGHSPRRAWLKGVAGVRLETLRVVGLACRHGVSSGVESAGWLEGVVEVLPNRPTAPAEKPASSPVCMVPRSQARPTTGGIGFSGPEGAAPLAAAAASNGQSLFPSIGALAAPPQQQYAAAYSQPQQQAQQQQAYNSSAQQAGTQPQAPAQYSVATHPPPQQQQQQQQQHVQQAPTPYASQTTQPAPNWFSGYGPPPDAPSQGQVASTAAVTHSNAEAHTGYSQPQPRRMEPHGEQPQVYVQATQQVQQHQQHQPQQSYPQQQQPEPQQQQHQLQYSQQQQIQQQQQQPAQQQLQPYTPQQTGYPAQQQQQTMYQQPSAAAAAGPSLLYAPPLTTAPHYTQY
ncbi:MAG: hypothetical protein WDW36_007821 [Sanguina aurantia]